MQKLTKQSDWILKSLVAAIVLAVPLFPKFPFIRVPGTFVSIRLEDFLIAVSFVAFLVIIRPKAALIVKKPIFRAIVLFLLVGLLSVLSSVIITNTTLPHISFLHWARRVEYFIPFFIGFYAIRNKQNLEFIIKLLMLVILISFLYGVGQKHFNLPVIITQNLEYSKGIALRWAPGSHISSTFAGHYDMAAFLVMVLPIIVTCFFVLKGIKTKISLLTIYFFGLWLLVNSASRISLVSFVFSAALALMLVKKYREIVLVILTSIVFIGFSSNLIERYQSIINVSTKRIPTINMVVVPVYAEEKAATINNGEIPIIEDRSTSIRLNVEWPRAIRAFTKNPLLGTGYSSITLATDNHYLRLLGEVGILGFMSFFLIFAHIIMVFLKILPLDNYYNGITLAFMAGIIGSLPGIFLNAVFIDVFEASKFAIMFWLLIGIAVYMAQNKILSKYKYS
jgi:hypothetical protein